MTKTIYFALPLILSLSILAFFAMTTYAFNLLGTPPLPEVIGIPSYSQAVALGNELASVTSEKTGRTFTPIIEKNLGGATYTIKLRELETEDEVSTEKQSGY